MSAITAIRKYTIQHYGNLISVEEPRFDNESKIWIAELKSDYPRIIRDDRSPDKRILKFLSLRELGTVKVGEGLQVEGTPREICDNKISSLLDMWQERAEKIIVRVSSNQLAKIDEARGVLAKIGMIISNLIQNNIILKVELDSFSGKQAKKIDRYLRLLESLNLVKQIDGNYTYGNLFAELLKKTDNNISEFKTAILSTIIKERYSALREIFGISQLETFVHIDSCYYRPAIEAEKLTYWTKDTILEQYTRRYGHKLPLRLSYILDELVNVEALRHEDKYYFGDEKLFSQMLEAKSSMIAPSHA